MKRTSFFLVYIFLDSYEYIVVELHTHIYTALHSVQLYKIQSQVFLLQNLNANKADSIRYRAEKIFSTKKNLVGILKNEFRSRRILFYSSDRRMKIIIFSEKWQIGHRLYYILVLWKMNLIFYSCGYFRQSWIFFLPIFYTFNKGYE